MRLRAHIYLDGLIGQQTDPFFSDSASFTAADVRTMIDAEAGAEELVVHINSQGGSVYEAFAIHDMLSRIKNVTTLGEGIVASAATIILLAGRKRQMTKNAELMIHNPLWSAEGNAEELQNAADELQRVEDKLTQFYADKTGTDAKQFDKWMAKDTFMTADEALSLGFITEIAEPLRAVATLGNNSNNQNSFLMNLISEVKNSIADLKATFLGVPKSLELTTADGKKFRVDTEANTEKLEPQVNNAVTIDGGAVANGDYIIPALGKTFTVAGGKITSIKETNEAGGDTGAAGAAVDSPEIKSLKEEIAKRDATINELTGKVNSQETALNEINLDIQMIKSNIVSSGFVAKDRTQNFSKSTDKKEPEKKNAFAEAFKRQDEEAEAKRKAK